MLHVSTRGEITRVELARTLLGRSLYAVSAFALGDTLIDSGCPATSRELLGWARGRGIRRVVNTHYHEDHSGGDALLARELGAEILAPADTVPRLAAFYRLPLYRRLTWGQPTNVAACPLADVVAVGPYRFEVIPTPGHSPDHVCLFDRDRGLLFSGDLYISARARYLRRGEDAWTIIASLRRVRALEPRVVICSHAGFLERPLAALDAKIAYWENLAERARALVDNGLAPPDVAARLLGPEGFLTAFSGGDFSKRNLVLSLLGGAAPVATAKLSA
ncbi:MAG: MBL fold metallo-hydrolase [Acidobacteriota bacterium]